MHTYGCMHRVALSLCLIAAALAVGAVSAPVWASGFHGPARGDVERVVDGDTVKVRVGVWIDQELLVSVRIAGVDAPELFRPKCAAEKEKARAAKMFVEEFIANGAVTLKDIKRGKYAGRVVARLEASGRDLGQALVDQGHAVKGARGAWC